VVRRVRALGLAVVCLAAIASSAQAATLSIRVPHHVRKGQRYTITITGSFKRDEVKGRAFLMAAIQFSAQPCQKTAPLENNLPNQPQFLWRSTPQVGLFEAQSPFTQRNGPWKPGLVGRRHICAWLYPQFVGPTDDIQPIARADAVYRVFRRS
jgi:hypothetical protein